MNDAYTTTAWISAEEWHKACKAEDTVLTVLVIDPIVRISFPVVLLSRVSPNAVTMLRLVVAVVSMAMFLMGHSWAGAVFFVAWYLLDCVDGKLARFTHRSSRFGDWLDRMTDRLGVGGMLWGMGIQQFWQGNPHGALAAFTLAVVWLLRVMNGERLSLLSKEVRVRTSGACPESGTSMTLKHRYAAWARSHRLTPWLMHDVEWLFMALVLGPLLSLVSVCSIAAIFGMILQTSLQTINFWLSRRNVSQLFTSPADAMPPSAALGDSPYPTSQPTASIR